MDRYEDREYNWKTKTFLIVEDDIVCKDFLYEILEDTNVNVIHAENGVEAVNICKDNKNIDLVLMDLMLPEKDGFTATQEIKEIRKDLPIIAQTAFGMTSDKAKSYQAGCNDFISKPIDSYELYKKISGQVE